MGDAREVEQTKFIKSQAKKLLDFLVKIAPISDASKETYRVGRETIKALEMVDGTMDVGMGQLSSSDDNLNRIAVIAQHLSNELSTLNRFDIDWWLMTSGANLFSRTDSTNALRRLQEQRSNMMNIKDGCAGMKAAAAIVFAASVANVKGLAKLYMPSIPAIDGYVTKDINETFDVCLGLADSIIAKIDTAIRTTADMTNSLDRFLIRTNTTDHRATVSAEREAAR